MIGYNTYYDTYYEYIKYIENAISSMLSHDRIYPIWKTIKCKSLSKSKSTFMLRYLNLLKRWYATNKSRVRTVFSINSLKFPGDYINGVFFKSTYMKEANVKMVYYHKLNGLQLKLITANKLPFNLYDKIHCKIYDNSYVNLILTIIRHDFSLNTSTYQHQFLLQNKEKVKIVL